jgi:Ala-tRNA(Pro) deacylase
MNIETYLQENGVQYTKCEHEDAYTAQEMAAEEHTSGHHVAKPVVVRADDRPVLVVLPASRKIDMDRLASVLSAKDIRLAEEGDIAKLFPDVELGAEPPFGEPYGLQTVVDETLAEEREIIFSAGDHRHSIHMRFADFARLTKPTLADFTARL